MITGFTTGHEAVLLRGEKPRGPAALSLAFYCSHVVIGPFPSLTNDPRQQCEDEASGPSVDLEQDHCCGSLIMQSNGSSSLCLRLRLFGVSSAPLQTFGGL